MRRARPAQTKPSAESENPYRRLHRAVYYLVVTCLFVQVIEGSLIVPFVLLYFGFPQLSLVEICDEMYKIVYVDDSRKCEYPAPLFRYEPEPWLAPSREELFGPVTPPAPGFDMPGFREVIERKQAREARTMQDPS